MSFLSVIWNLVKIAIAVYNVVSARAKTDPAFKAELVKAAGLAKTARTEKELGDAAQAFQDSLFR